MVDAMRPRSTAPRIVATMARDNTGPLRGTSDRVDAQHDVWNDVACVHLTCASVL